MRTTDFAAPHDADHKLTSREAFTWLWSQYLKPYKLILCAALALMVVEGSMLGCISWLLQPMFDDVFSNNQSGQLFWVAAAICTVFFIRAVTSMGHSILLTKVNHSASASLRHDLLAHLMALESLYHQSTSPGQTIERVQSDVMTMCSAWITVFVSLGRDLVAILVLFGVAINVDLAWTAIALIGAPLLITPALIAQKYVRKRSGYARDIAAKISTRLDEVLHGINAVKLNTLESYQLTRYDDLAHKRTLAEVKSAAGQATVPALVDIMTGVGFFAVILYGGAEILSGEKTIGQFMSFFTAMSLTFGPLRKLGSIGGQWEMAAASIERIRAILHRKPRISSPHSPQPLSAPIGHITFENVSLTYNDLPALKNISFTAPIGQTTAFVGASGAGKSTIFNVLTRLVDPSHGRVLLGNTPIDHIDLHELRQLFSTVSQETALFDDSIKTNILFDAPDLSEQALDQLLTSAHIDSFLSKLPQGLDSPAGPRGSNLSGGQRQRIAIARALLRDSPILLLDEATSALDTKSETIIQSALEALSKQKTTLVIAHRLSTIRAADNIIVMDQGQIIAQGTHQQLIAQGGLYAELCQLQFGAQNTSSTETQG